MKLGSVLGGGGARTGGICGTVTGALLIIGLKHGATDPDDNDSKTKAYDLARKFMRQFRERNGSAICRELIGFDIGTREDLTSDDWAVISRRCPKFLSDASELLDNILPAAPDQ